MSQIYNLSWNFVNVINVIWTIIKCHVYSNICTYIQICVYSNIAIYVHIYTYVYIYTYKREHIWVLNLFVEQMNIVTIQWTWFWILTTRFIGYLAFGRPLNVSKLLFSHLLNENSHITSQNYCKNWRGRCVCNVYYTYIIHIYVTY